jgi:hypothetical protein
VQQHINVVVLSSAKYGLESLGLTGYYNVYLERFHALTNRVERIRNERGRDKPITLPYSMPGNTEQGKCWLMNEYPFFLFLIGRW